MKLAELEDLIEEIERWHKIRGGLNVKRSTEKRKPMVMETLPWVLEALYDYRSVLVEKEAFSEEPEGTRKWTTQEILEGAG